MGINVGERTTEKGNLRRRCHNFIRENKLLVLLICLIIVGIVIGALLACVAPIILKRAARPYRLPSDIVPYHYNLEVKPYLIPDNSKFEGYVEIYVTCAKTTDLITLHSKDLKINENSIKIRSIDEGEDLKVLLVYYDTSNDLLLLRLLEDLKERHRYRIYIKYKGPLERGYSGFYISSYEDNEESTHYVASTHFEPDEARKAFPCFDEPAYKSTFNVTLVRWKNTTSLSNMPRYRMEDREMEWIADVFEKSMRMSTYLVAFVFCDYVGTTKGKVTVWSPAHRKENAEYALNVSVKFLKFFEEKLQIPYPGPKLDMVPVESLGSLAMENWGLIIYDESNLLTSNETQNEKEKFFGIAGIIAHEIAHQWFGNLVTAKWWSDIWLNEGITSYMRDIAEIELFPEMSKVDPSISSVDTTIMIDCYLNTPLLSPVTSSEEASEKFSFLIYNKGRSVIRMAHKILGDTIFWKGIRRYLNSNAYENVEDADLWRYLTTAQSSRSDRLDMAEIMYSWTHLSGAPMVTINRDYERRTATISQESCQSRVKEHENDLWNVPLIFSKEYHTNYFNKIKLLKKQNMTIEGMPSSDEWIIVTTDSSGYYLVNYDRKNWNLLCEQLRSYHEIFDATQRHKLLAEITYFEGMGNIDVDLVFQCLLYVKEEREPEVFWKTIHFINGYLNFFDQSRYYDWLREYIIYIWKDTYHRFGWKEKEYKMSYFNWESAVGSSVTEVLCKLRYAPCVEEALARYSTLKTKKADELNLFNYTEMVPLCTFVQNATEEEWNNVKKTLFSEDFRTVYFVLECSDNAAVVREELYVSLKESVSSADLLHNALKSSDHVFREYVYFIEDNFETFIADITSEEGFQHLMKRTSANAWKIEKLSRVFTKHYKHLTGSNAENMEAFLQILKEKLEETKTRTKILKEWLDRKPWTEKE